MHLVLDHVTQLKHVGNTYCCALVKRLTCAAVIKLSLTVARQTCLISPFIKIIYSSTVKYRGSELDTQLTAGVTKNGLEYLTDVHT